MKTGIASAILLGIVLGVGLAYALSTQSSATPRPELMMQPITAQANLGAGSASNKQSSGSVLEVLIPFVIGLLFALPVFLFARHRTS
ncbi:MAG TPA: hypothetical protein VLV31_05340 [Candidatus Acidoferrales bacterium]|nr:hypothetical protein [Candidatus Acidoferrales bacterium]